MTEKFFEAHGVKKEPMKGGLACLLNFPIPDWAVKKKKDGTIEPKLWDLFEALQYAVSFVPFYSIPEASMLVSPTGKKKAKEPCSRPWMKQKRS